MEYKIWIQIGDSAPLEQVIHIPAQDLNNIDEVIDDHVSEFITEKLKVHFAPVRGS